MIVDYFNFAISNFGKRKIRSFLTMLGIFIGIAAVVSLISLGQGMKDAVNQQFAGIGTDKITIQAAGVPYGPPGSTVVRKLDQDVTEQVSRVKGVKLVAERMIRSVKVSFNGKEKYETTTSIPKGEAGKLVIEAAQVKIDHGRLVTDSDSSKVVLGNNFYSKKDKYGKIIDVGNTVKLNGKNFLVIGILQKAGNPIMNNIVLLNDRDFRDTLNVGKEVDLIVAQVQPGENVDSVVSNIERQLRKFRGVEKGKEDFTVQSAQQTIETLNSILNVIQYILIGIAGISLFVGGVGIMNTMFTSVYERRKEIGIMKSVGAKNSDILLLFLFESGLLGIFGGVIGLLLGMGLSKIVEFVGKAVLNTQLLRADFTLFLIIGSLIFSFVVGAVSGLVPAYQASKLHPVEALRK